MFGTSITLPHSGGNIVCGKINQDGYTGEYRLRSATQQVSFTVRHTTTKTGLDRHNVEVIQQVYATGETAEVRRKVYIVMEQAPSDMDITLVDALCDWLIASAGANSTLLLQWGS